MKKSSTELKSLARTTLLGRYGTPIGACVFTSLAPTILLIPFQFLTENNSLVSNIVYLIAVFLIGILSSLLMVGGIKLHLNMARNLPYQFSDVFLPFNMHPQRFIGATVLISLLVFLFAIPYVIFLVLWVFNPTNLIFVLFIAGIILLLIASVMISLRYALIYYLLLDHPDMPVLSAFQESSRLMSGNKGRLFYLGVSFIGFTLLGICSCYIGFLWIGPYIMSTMTHFYLDVTAKPDSYTDDTYSNDSYNNDTYTEHYDEEDPYNNSNSNY